MGTFPWHWAPAPNRCRGKNPSAGPAHACRPGPRLATTAGSAVDSSVAASTEELCRGPGTSREIVLHRERPGSAKLGPGSLSGHMWRRPKDRGGDWEAKLQCRASLRAATRPAPPGQPCLQGMLLPGPLTGDVGSEQAERPERAGRRGASAGTGTASMLPGGWQGAYDSSPPPRRSPWRPCARPAAAPEGTRSALPGCCSPPPEGKRAARNS